MAFYKYSKKTCMTHVHLFYGKLAHLFLAPVFMPSPSVFPLSPYSLNVSWEKPQDNVARGEVMGYSINVITTQNMLPVFSQVLLSSICFHCLPLYRCYAEEKKNSISLGVLAKFLFAYLLYILLT